MIRFVCKAVCTMFQATQCINFLVQLVNSFKMIARKRIHCFFFTYDDCVMSRKPIVARDSGVRLFMAKFFKLCEFFKLFFIMLAISKRNQTGIYTFFGLPTCLTESIVPWLIMNSIVYAFPANLAWR